MAHFELLNNRDQFDDRDGKLLEQYFSLVGEKGENLSIKPAAMDILEGRTCYALLVENEKVLAGATIKFDRFGYEICDGRHLPDKSEQPICTAHVTDVVATKDDSYLMPGLNFQKELLKAFSEGKLNQNVYNVDAMVGYVVAPNALTLHEAAKDLNLRAVVRKDLVHETPNGRAFFVAATTNPDVSLVPDGRENQVANHDELRQLAHAEIIRFKKEHPRVKSSSPHDNTPGWL